ncbi:hypothetical protein D3C78_1530110 [compost metagenome]
MNTFEATISVKTKLFIYYIFGLTIYLDKNHAPTLIKMINVSIFYVNRQLIELSTLLIPCPLNLIRTQIIHSTLAYYRPTQLWRDARHIIGQISFTFRANLLILFFNLMQIIHTNTLQSKHSTRNFRAHLI